MHTSRQSIERSSPFRIAHFVPGLMICLISLLCACGYDPSNHPGDDDQSALPATSSPDPGDDDDSSPTPTPPIGPTACTDADADEVCLAEDCDDGDPKVYPGAREFCDGKDDDCDNALPVTEADSDGDGQSACQGDCDDSEPQVYKGAKEICDGLDSNCDGTTSSNEKTDADHDGVLGCADCNDSDAAIYPGAPEACDDKDNNCDGTKDEGATTLFYRDSDNDGYGNAKSSLSACAAPAGYVASSTDCDDANPIIYPGATEACDGFDNNCNTQIDEGVKSTWYQDSDKDGFGNSSKTTQSCTVPSGYVASGTDCDDTNKAINPGATETCNGIDDDCDALTDEGVTPTWYLDSDKDGYGNPGKSSAACTAPTGYVSSNTDCDDANAAVHPGVTETCNGLDDNCDGVYQSGETVDADADGYPSCNDCNDSSAAVHPGASEVCDGLDNNCSGKVDEGFSDTDSDNIPDCLDDCPRWVDIAGNPLKADGGYNTPFTAIQQALDAADPPTCRYVRVRPGTYNEKIDFLGKGIDLAASTAGKAIIDGTGQLGPVVSFISQESSSASLAGFVIQDGEGDDGAPPPDGSNAPGCGGGIRIWGSSPMIQKNTITGNHGQSGGGICVLGGSPYLNGNDIDGNDADKRGGGIFLGHVTTLNLATNTLSANNSSGSGGGLYCASTGSGASIFGNAVVDNDALDQGGGLFIDTGCLAGVSGNEIDTNMATQGGGAAIYAPSSSSFTLSGPATMSGNMASDGGGAVFIGASTGGMIITRYIIQGGSAQRGAGIFVDKSAATTLETVTLTGNVASQSGGGLYIGQQAQFVMHGGEISKNTAVNGGGVYADAAYSFVMGDTATIAIIDNKAAEKGGGMYLNKLLTTINVNNLIASNTVTGNTAANGAGVEAVECSISFRTNTIQNNVASATNSAGGVLCEGTQKMSLGLTNIITKNTPNNTLGCN